MKKVIIVGAGIAGLAAGIYACQSGFDVTIYESHTIPGGASTSWRRNGYLFEGGMHWLTGSAKNTPLYRLWREIGALEEDTPMHLHDPFFNYHSDGKTVSIYRDIDKLREHLLAIAPEDEKEIDNLCKDIRKFTKVSKPITDIKGVKVKEKASIHMTSMVSMIPAVSRMSFYSKQSSEEYAARFQNPLLRELFKNMVGEENTATGLMFTLSTLASGDGGYPSGGSLKMAERIAQKFTGLGGKIQYNTYVDKVLVKNNTAAGIVVNGQEILADAVIVTQDTLMAIDTLFDPPIQEPWAKKMRKETKPVLDTFVCLGIKTKLLDIPKAVILKIKAPISCGGQQYDHLMIYNYAGFSDYAPKGCTALTSIFSGDSYDWWNKQKQEGTYEAEKEKLADAFSKALIENYPQIEGKIEVFDVATPLTYERYLHSYKGSWMTVMLKDSKIEMYPSKPDSIKNLYFAGHRLMAPGGLPVAVETGRMAVQYLCLDTDSVFQGEMSAAVEK